MATQYGGYMGKVLKIDLTTKEVSEYPFSDRERELFIGGKTMAAKILGDHLKGTEKAFSTENPLFFHGNFLDSAKSGSNRLVSRPEMGYNVKQNHCFC